MDQFTSNCVIIVVIAVILILAVKYSIPHFKGEGSCCGGGSKMKLIKPAKLDKVIAQKTVLIEGMVCDHCSGRIHNALNSIEGVNAKVIRSKKKAIVIAFYYMYYQLLYHMAYLYLVYLNFSLYL